MINNTEKNNFMHLMNEFSHIKIIPTQHQMKNIHPQHTQHQTSAVGFKNKTERSDEILVTAYSPPNVMPGTWTMPNSPTFRNQSNRNSQSKLSNEVKKDTHDHFVRLSTEQSKPKAGRKMERLSAMPTFYATPYFKKDKPICQKQIINKQSEINKPVKSQVKVQMIKNRLQTYKSQIGFPPPLPIKDIQFKLPKNKETTFENQQKQDKIMQNISIIKTQKTLSTQVCRKKSANHAQKQIKKNQYSPLTPQYKSIQQIQNQKKLFLPQDDDKKQLPNKQSQKMGLFNILLKKNATRANLQSNQVKNHSQKTILQEPIQPPQHLIPAKSKYPIKTQIQSKTVILSKPPPVIKNNLITIVQEKLIIVSQEIKQNKMLQQYSQKQLKGNQYIQHKKTHNKQPQHNCQQLKSNQYIQHKKTHNKQPQHNFLQSSKTHSSISSAKTTIQSVTCPRKKISIKDFQLFPDRLGKGAFGDVFMAREIQTNFLCVLKRLSKKKMKENPKQEQFIMREIKIQLYLNHPNLTEMYGFFSDSENVYLILQVLKDSSLQQKRAHRRLSQNTVAGIVYQVAQGLRYMHEHEVMHRDIKPQNLMMHEDVVKIGDFGCAMVLNQGLRKTFMGCIEYSSPQQLKAGVHDQMIDIWSLGILTYQLLTARPPFTKEILGFIHNNKQQQHSRAVNNLTFPQQLNLQPQTKDFVLKILKQNPKDRADFRTILTHPFLKDATQAMSIKRSKETKQDEKQLFQESKKEQTPQQQSLRLSAPLSPSEPNKVEVIKCYGRLSSGNKQPPRQP